MRKSPLRSCFFSWSRTISAMRSTCFSELVSFSEVQVATTWLNQQAVEVNQSVEKAGLGGLKPQVQCGLAGGWTNVELIYRKTTHFYCWWNDWNVWVLCGFPDHWIFVLDAGRSHQPTAQLLALPLRLQSLTPAMVLQNPYRSLDTAL